jgi:putative addiction module component (TIGR02574 family)
MSAMITALGLDRLSSEERVALANELWDSVPPSQRPARLTESLRAELRRRAAEADADPDGGIPWEQVKAEGRKRFKS